MSELSGKGGAGWKLEIPPSTLRINFDETSHYTRNIPSKITSREFASRFIPELFPFKKKKVQFFFFVQERGGKIEEKWHVDPIIPTKFHLLEQRKGDREKSVHGTILSIPSPDGNNGFVSAPCPISIRRPSCPPSTSILVQRSFEQAPRERTHAFAAIR